VFFLQKDFLDWQVFLENFTAICKEELMKKRIVLALKGIYLLSVFISCCLLLF